MKFFVLFIIALLIVSCQVLNDSESENIESALLGEWMSVEEHVPSNPSPHISYNGWSIKSDGAMYTLGVDGETGEIEYYNSENRRSTSILFARNGKMLVRHGTLAIREDTVSYFIDGAKLSIEGNVLQGTFKRTSIGSVITSPPATDFFIKINDTEFHNRSVGVTVPTAYISKMSDSRFIIRSYLSGDSHSMTVIIENYKGQGTYSIDEGQGQYHYTSGSMVIRWITRFESSGTVTIKCDMYESRCTGVFSFDAYRSTAPAESVYMKSFERGSFDLPVYE